MASLVPAGVMLIVMTMSLVMDVTSERRLGPFQNTTEGLTGNVSILDGNTFKISDFTYKGTVYFAGLRRTVNANNFQQLVAFQHESGINNKVCGHLPQNQSDLLVIVPHPLSKVSDFSVLSVHDTRSCALLGAVNVPANVFGPSVYRILRKKGCSSKPSPCSRVRSYANPVKVSSNGTDKPSTTENISMLMRAGRVKRI